MRASSADRSPDATIRAGPLGRRGRALPRSRTRRSRSRPTPDMRTKLAPGCGLSQASTVAICGTSAIAGASRSLRPSRQSSSGPRSIPSQPANTPGRQAATRGLTSRTGVPASSGKSRASAVARPLARAGIANRQAGTSLPSAGATASACAGSICHNGRQQAKRGAPHRPSRRRCPTRPASLLSRRKAAPASMSAASRSALAARSTRLSSPSADRAAKGPEPRATTRRPARRQLVAVRAKGENRLDRMASVGQFSADMEREVELRRREARSGGSRRGVGGRQARFELGLESAPRHRPRR